MNEISEKDIEEYKLDSKEELHKRVIKIDPALFSPKEINIANAHYDMDILQNKLLEKYLRQDIKFRVAFHTNYTPYFFQFLMDKVRLKEPHHIAVMGNVRCQPQGSKVLMSNGEWKNIEEITIGDKVLSPQFDGSYLYSKVIGTSINLSNKSYDISQRNRQNRLLYSCSENHIIPVFHRHTPRINKKDSNSKKYAVWGVLEHEAKELANFNRSLLKCTKIGISSFPIPFFEGRTNCEIEPYSLGVYLGDGSFTQSLIITNSNLNILEEINKFYPPNHTYPKKNSKSKDYKYLITSDFALLLTKYGLRNKKSGEKFIPKKALYSDLNYRRRLLAGLIDTDGYLSKGLAYSIITKSKQMAQDILFLIYSLGGRATITKQIKGIKKLNFEGEYYKVSFYLGKEIKSIPLLVSYKKRNNDRFFYISPNRIALSFKKIEKPQLVYGFEIDSPSKWYITDNFMITHNSGKSYSMMTLICFINALYGRKTTIHYICANAHEFLENLRMMPSSLTLNSAFLVDEDKQAVFGYGSVARQQKISDVQNIIAMNNISTITINPTKFTNTDAFYGLRTFGRCTKTKTCRFMLYNLQESSSGHLPLGMVYIPIFPEVVPYWRELERDYLIKKKTWIQNEAMGLGDVLMKLQKREAERFYEDSTFRGIKTKKARLTYIRMRLGSEWTLNQCEEIMSIVELMEKYRVDLHEKEKEEEEDEAEQPDEEEDETEIISEDEAEEI